MSVRQGFLRLVNAGGEISRPTLVGMEFLHEGAVRPRDLGATRPGLQAKDLVGLLFRHFAARRTAPPRCRVFLRVLTPAGRPA